jgi:hypothetical protein
MKTSVKSVGFAACVTIDVASLIYYVLMAIEYITQYFIARVSELYLRSIPGIVNLTRPLTTSRSSGVRLSPPRLAGRIWGDSLVGQVARVAQRDAVIAGMVSHSPMWELVVVRARGKHIGQRFCSALICLPSRLY